MSEKYLTEQFQSERALRSQELASDSLRSVHDVLLFASKHGLDVSMLCRDWTAHTWVEEYETQVGESFAVSLRRVLDRGGVVRSLIWNIPQRGLVFPQVSELLQEFGEPKTAKRGQLIIRVSGIDTGAKEIVQFVCAHGDNAEPPCAIRLGYPRAEKARGKVLEPFHLRRGATYIGDEAVPQVRTALEVFDQLFGEKGFALHRDRPQSRVDIKKLIDKKNARAKAI